MLPKKEKKTGREAAQIEKKNHDLNYSIINVPLYMYFFGHPFLRHWHCENQMNFIWAQIVPS